MDTVHLYVTESDRFNIIARHPGADVTVLYRRGGWVWFVSPFNGYHGSGVTPYGARETVKHELLRGVPVAELAPFVEFLDAHGL